MRQAQKTCTNCTVAEICLWSALVVEDPTYRHGVYGGLLPRQRAQLAELCDHGQVLELLESELGWWVASKAATA